MRSWNSPKDVHRLTVALLALFTVASSFAILVQQHFCVDGASFFAQVLKLQSYNGGADVPRHHAHYVTQSLTVLLIKAGVRDADLLSVSFGVSLYLPLVAGVAISAFVARRADPRFVLFPLISLFGVAANHTYMIIHESHVTAALFWPLLFLVLFEERFDWRGAAFALGLSLLFIRTYESVAPLGAIVVASLGLRMREGWRRATPLTRTVWVLLLLVLLGGIAIAVHYSLNPRLPGNRADFFASFARILEHWPALMSLSFIAAIVLFFAIPGLSSSVAAPVLTAALAVAALAVGFSPVLAPEAMMPGLHHATRSHLTVMVPALAVLAVVVVRGHLAVADETWRRVAVLVCVLAVGQTTWQVLAAGQWSGFRRVFQEELAARRGVTAFEDTALARVRIGNQLLRPMTWGWTQPTLSILWAPGRQVRTVILNPATEQGRWQPFNPTAARALPDLSAFGYSLDAYRDSLPK